MKTGVAFSGGGIRSAALCSGVLRRLLKDGVEPDYLSCVSGGGYTGAAYMDWKYRNKGKDQTAWHDTFFKQIETHSGLFCDWQNCCSGFCDCLIFGIMMIGVLGLSLWAFMSFAFPLAFLVDSLPVGRLLEAKRFRCKETDVDCEFPVGSMSFKRMLLFVCSFLIFVIFHIIARFCRSGTVNFIKVSSGSAFAFTFFPWFINDYLEYTGWVGYFIIAVSVVTWFFLPVLRHYSSLVIIVYASSYVVYWHVYEEKVLGIQHKEKDFFWILFGSLIFWYIALFTGEIQLRIVHIYNRWRLQKAFFTEESAKRCGGIGLFDCFPGSYLCTPKTTDLQARTTSEQRTGNGEPLSSFNKEGALTLADLKPLKPQYISNIVVNEWRVRSKSKDNYSLLTMSPNEIERLTFKYKPKEEPQATQATPDNFAGKLDPGDIKLSAAMAMSAAAFSPHMGNFKEEEQAFTHILTCLGLDMAANVALREPRMKIFYKCCSLFIPFLFAVLVAILPILHAADVCDAACYRKAFGVGSVVVFILAFLCVLICECCECSKGGCSNNVLRWLTVHVPLYRFLRAIFCSVHTGPVPPPMLHLSDGGHFENLGLLPLLQRRLQRILVINGGYIKSDSSYGEDLVKALDLAREKLNCSFIGIDGRDVLEDIKDKFVKKKDGEKPRHYKFRVQYYDKTEELSEGERDEEKDGEIILISPRHPNKGVDSSEVAPDRERSCCCCCCYRYKRTYGDYDVEAALTADDVDHLSGCCCERCHGISCKPCCKSECECCERCCSMCTFPANMTLNQFFTPAMFRSYHCEGYRACQEANAVEFLNVNNKEQRPKDELPSADIKQAIKELQRCPYCV